LNSLALLRICYGSRNKTAKVLVKTAIRMLNSLGCGPVSDHLSRATVPVFHCSADSRICAENSTDLACRTVRKCLSYK
jgi:hypothetical protein